MNVRFLSWLVLTILFTIAVQLAIKFIKKIKFTSDKKKFSNKNYRIGAAAVNMERAMLYGDSDNFKFFARYAIRSSLGLPSSYPPYEPTCEEIIKIISDFEVDEGLLQKILKLYTLDELPQNSVEWKALLVETKEIVKILFLATKKHV